MINRKNKKFYHLFFSIGFLIVVSVVIFNNSFFLNIFEDFLVWKNNIFPQTISEQKIVLDNFYYFENLELKKELNYQYNFNKKRKHFLILSRGENNIYDTFLISDPQKVLQKDDLVLGGFNFALGRVFKVGKIARFKLFSSVGEKNTFLLSDSENKINFDVEATGEGGGILRVMANRGMEFSKNTVLKLIDSQDYLVAKLVRTEFQEQDPEKTLFFQILINPYGINKVSVEK